MTGIIPVVFLLLLSFSVCFRLAVSNFPAFVFYAVKDALSWFLYRKWDICQTGHLICYTALFGRGKTLSVVHYITGMYRRYNNKGYTTSAVRSG